MKSHCLTLLSFHSCDFVPMGINNDDEKSAWRRCKHCTQAVMRQSQKFSSPQIPFPGAQDGQNLISWRRSLPLPTNPVWWGSMHADSSYRGNRPTNTPTHTQTDMTDCNTLCHSFASSQGPQHQTSGPLLTIESVSVEQNLGDWNTCSAFWSSLLAVFRVISWSLHTVLHSE